ncbi:TonB-dependent receptor plug domain-containing protein [Roseateles sp.]|uniref:TonB-dependent receptor plug domain-containing protein n=1 Tax=Roseateles sp. TaxID=1971397 RepID=UPI0039E773EC
MINLTRLRPSNIALAVLALSAPAFAQTAPTTGEVFTLGTVSVTGTRAQVGEMPQDQAGSLVTRQQMQQFGRETVGDAANLLPGVSIASNSRNELMVYLRGFDARQVPLFIDGVPVYVPYDGYVDFNRFGTYDIAALQVAKGFSSIAYGPNALGGAINVVTRKPSRAFEGDAFVGAAAGGDRKAGINLGTRQGHWYLQAGLSWREADGFRLPSDFQPTATEDGGLRNNSDRRDSKLSFKLGLTPNASDEYALSYYKQDGQKGQPPTTGSTGVRYWRWPFWDKESLYFVSTTALGSSERVKLRLYRDRFDNEVTSYTDATYTRLRTSGQGSVSTGRSIYHDRTDGGAVELESTRFAGHVLRAVLQHRQDRHEELDANATRGALFEDTLRSVGLEDLITIAPRWQLALGVARHELRPDSVYSNGNAYGLPSATRATNLQAGLFRDLGAGQQAYASLSRKTRLPTLKDRYSQRLGSYVENPALGAERSLNAELGYQGRAWGTVEVEAALFHSRVDDKIQSAFVAGGSSCSAATPCQMRNVGEVRVNGIELGARGSITGRLELGGNLTVLDQKNVSNPDIRLLAVPDRKLFAYARFTPMAQVWLQASVEHNAKRWASNTAALHGYTLLGLKASWRMPDGLSLEAGLDNAADKLYELDAGFPAPGRTWFANARYEF